MMLLFIVANGFTLALLFPTHLESPLADTRVPVDPTGVWLAVGTLPRAMFTSFNMMMGGFDAQLLNDAYWPLLAWAVFFVFVLVVNIVMLNLLIALMGGSYERVAETAKMETLKQRAKLIVEYEQMMSTQDLDND